MDPKIRSTGSTGNGPAPAMASQPATGSPGKPATESSAGRATAPVEKNRGGKPRQDGLAPGSSAAKEADLKRDRERKQKDNGVALPPTLPSAGTPAPGPVPTSVNGLVPGPVAPAAGQSDVVPWDPATLRPLLEEFIQAGEQSRIQKRKSRAVAVGLPDRIVKEVAGDAGYPESAKRALALSGSNGTAKILNGLGVSGKYSDAAIAITAMIAILVSNRRSDARFEELIAEFKKQSQPQPNKPAEAKP